MKIKRLEIASFRGIDHLNLEFTQTEPTVFIGINGVGKTSVLDCVAILLSWLTEGIQFNSESNKSESKQFGRLLYDPFPNLPKTIKGEGSYFSQHDIKHNDERTQSQLTIIFDTTEFQWSIGTKKSAEHIKQIQSLEPVTNKMYSQWKSDSNANIPIAVYYPVNRAVIDISLEREKEPSFLSPILLENSESNSPKQIDAYEDSLKGVQIGFDSFFQWFKNLEDLENEERRDNPNYRDKQLEAVRQAISSLMPGFSNLRVRRSPKRMTLTKQGQELLVNQLSDGEKCLLAMVGDLARRLAIASPGLEAPLQGAGVVLIDEIELHLHPAWQRRIIPELTEIFPNCQFIVTTHSPQVISNVKPNGIYILEATPGGIIANHPESSFGRDSNRILEDIMGVPERPQEIKEKILELFRLIDEGNLAEAKKKREHLAELIGVDEPEFARADVLMRRQEILNR